jgi:transposase-like protein
MSGCDRINRAGLYVVRKPDRRASRKRRMTASKIKSVKRLLAHGAAPRRDVNLNLDVSISTLYRRVLASVQA